MSPMSPMSPKSPMTTLGQHESGNAIVEFVVLAMLMMLPLVYILLTIFRVQSATYALSSASLESGRVFVTAPSVADAAPQALAAARLVMADSGLTLRTDEVAFTCSSNPCLRPGSRVTVVLTYQVDLPLVPRFLAGNAPASVRISSRHLEVVDRFRVAAKGAAR